MMISIIYGALLVLLIALNLGLLFRQRAFRNGLPTLREWRGPLPPVWPRVSVIVPCRNEAAGVVAAVSSLFAQDYPDLEIVAVNDRSDDETGALLDGLAEQDARLTVLHIRTLPAGWLGKIHAVHEGARRATGEWLLFTDGDVVFAPDALQRSVAFATAHGLGHFVALPKFVADGFLERAFLATFALTLSAKLDPSKLSVLRSRAFVGVGAFGLVHRDAYARIGGHERLAYEVADDLKLGLLLRRRGVAQGCLDADGLVSVRWQNGLLATLRGLEKNAFAGCEWRGSLAVLAVLLVLASTVLPYLPLVLPLAAWTHPLAVIAAGLPLLAVGLSARRVSGGSGLEGCLAPLAALALAGVIAWSTVLTLARGGILWRGTFYPLNELRRNCVREWSMSTVAAVGWTPPQPPQRDVRL
jgi:hypothetical protein